MSTTPKDELEDLEVGGADVTGGGIVKKVSPDTAVRPAGNPSNILPTGHENDPGINPHSLSPNNFSRRGPGERPPGEF